ncbi:MAG TPA: ABC transporter substrate-binding protein [Anaerolineae bacterium]|nr:ABC transporter substrate-binding protein [Anaerolineae bacterium]HMR65853.1 ABC transporter substrate-binding protein [Anaerolineae bacterium]
MSEATSLPSEASAPAPNEIIFGLDWAFVGQHVPFFVALDKGFWEEEGVTVEVVRGYGSADAVQKVAAGSTTIGYGDTGSLIVGRTEGVDVKLIGMVLGLPPHAVIYQMDQPIDSPVDLEGKKIGAAAGDSVRRVFPAFAKIAGFDVEKVEFVTIGYEIYSAELLSGRINGLAEYYAAKPNYDRTANENDVELGILKFSDYGFDIYSNGFLAKESFVTENPETVKAFLKGVYRGFAYAYENPDESVDIMLKYAPTLERDVIKEQFLLDKPAVLNADVLANGYGYIDADKMQHTIDAMIVAYELSENIPTPEEMYTIDFLPSKDEIPPVE